MKRIGLVVLPLILVGLGGCIGGSVDDPQVDFEEIEGGWQSGVEEFRTVTVRDPAQWDRLYAEHNPNVEPPRIDFSGSMVLAVFGGERPDTCYRVEIFDIVLGVGEVVAKVDRAVVEDGLCGYTVAYPYHFVRVDLVGVDVAYQVVER